MSGPYIPRCDHPGCDRDGNYGEGFGRQRRHWCPAHAPEWLRDPTKAKAPRRGPREPGPDAGGQGRMW